MSRQINKNRERGFKGVWIPKELWLNPHLSITECVFLAEIDSLDKDEKGCWAENEHFEGFFGLSKGRVKQIIASLVKRGWISSEILHSAKKGCRRRMRGLWKNITIPPQPPDNKLDHGSLINYTTPVSKTRPPSDNKLDLIYKDEVKQNQDNIEDNKEEKDSVIKINDSDSDSQRQIKAKRVQISLKLYDVLRINGNKSNVTTCRDILDQIERQIINKKKTPAIFDAVLDEARQSKSWGEFINVMKTPRFGYQPLRRGWISPQKRKNYENSKIGI